MSGMRGVREREPLPISELILVRCTYSLHRNNCAERRTARAMRPQTVCQRGCVRTVMAGAGGWWLMRGKGTMTMATVQSDGSSV